MAVGEVFTAPVERIGDGGDGLVRLMGKPVLVGLAAPGELVTGRICRESRGTAWAELLDIREPSPERIPPVCPRYGVCGGCSLQHLPYEAQLREKTTLLQDAFRRIGGFSSLPAIAVHPSPAWEYRNRMQFHRLPPEAALPPSPRRRFGGGIGLMGRRSNVVVPVPDCPIADPRIRRALGEFAPGALPPRLPATLKPPPDKDRFTVYGRDALLLSEGGVRQGAVELRGRRFLMDAGLFFQSNAAAQEDLITGLLDAAGKADQDRPAADLYCGVGVFASFLQDLFPRLDLVEENRTALGLARENLQPRGDCRFFPLPCEGWVREGGARVGDYGFMVVDPPRQGLSPLLRRFLVEKGPALLAYVSCKPATLARDSRDLCGEGGYALEELTLYDFYPQTAHIESLALFRRNGPLPSPLGERRPAPSPRLLRGPLPLALAVLALGALFPGGFPGGGEGVHAQEAPLQEVKPAWRTALGGAIRGFPSVQAETVAVVCDGGNLKTFSRQGAFLWDYFARDKLAPHVSRSMEGTSYICTVNGVFIVVNRAGRELWRVDLGEPLAYPALVGWDGRLFIPGKGRLSCYTAGGTPLWGQDLGGPIALEPQMDRQGGLLLVLEKGELLRVSPFGKRRSRQLPGLPAALLSLGAEETGGALLVFYQDGSVERLDWGNAGEPDPRGRPFPPLPAAPLAAAAWEDRAAVLLKDGRVLLLSTADGSVRWTGESHIAGPGRGAAAAAVVRFDERGIYVLSHSGATAFSGEGEGTWLLRLEGAAAIPAFGDDGLLFAGGEDWVLYGYQMEKPKPRKKSLYGPPAQGSYGMGNPPPSPWAAYLFSLDEGAVEAELGRIEEAARRGRIGEEEVFFTAFLMELAGIFHRRPWLSSDQPPIHFRQRIRAAGLLGALGSRETIPFLVELFRRDPEPLVRAAAARAIGRIGVDPEGTAFRAFSALLRPGVLAVEDEQVLAAVAAATGALCRFSGPPLSEGGLRILRALGEESYPPVVRKQAQRELGTLGSALIR